MGELVFCFALSFVFYRSEKKNVKRIWKAEHMIVLVSLVVLVQ